MRRGAGPPDQLRTHEPHPSITGPKPVDPLPISLHFALCCFAATVEDELLWTALAAQIFGRQPIMSGTLLQPLQLPDGSTVNPWSPGDRVQIVADDQDGESVQKAIPGLDARPHLRYVANGVQIDMS